MNDSSRDTLTIPSGDDATLSEHCLGRAIEQANRLGKTSFFEDTPDALAVLQGDEFAELRKFARFNNAMGASLK